MIIILSTISDHWAHCHKHNAKCCMCVISFNFHNSESETIQFKFALVKIFQWNYGQMMTEFGKARTSLLWSWMWSRKQMLTFKPQAVRLWRMWEKVGLFSGEVVREHIAQGALTAPESVSEGKTAGLVRRAEQQGSSSFVWPSDKSPNLSRLELLPL